MDVVVADSATDQMRQLANRWPARVVRLLDDVDEAVASGNLSKSRLTVPVGAEGNAKAFLVGQGPLRALLTIDPASPEQVVVASVLDLEAEDTIATRAG